MSVSLRRAHIIALLLAAAPLLSQASDRHAGSEIKVAVGNATEAYERDVDQAALSAQEKSIAKLSSLLKKYRGTHQEPIFLYKLGELQNQTASIQFRIAHGAAHGGKTAVNLSAYRKTMRAGISVFSELIARYPQFEEVPQAYFYRGKSFEEIGDKKSATSDYLKLVKEWPEAEPSTSAYMSLAQFAIDDNKHPEAITFLKEIEKRPESPHFPFALYKLAWSHYNLKAIPTALSYLERHVAYYNARLKDSTEADSLTSDAALRENSLLDATTFYLEGFEQKVPQYQVKDALAYFRKLHDGQTLGKMLVRFSKLLRSHGYEEELIGWKNQVLQAESARPEALDVVLTVYENQLNKRRFPELTETAQDMVRLYQKNPKAEALPSARKMLLDTAEQMQAILIKNKGADGVAAMSQNLASIYDAFVKIVEDSDPRIPRVHYNLAETLFEIKDYEQATVNYRWVVEHGKWNKADKSIASVQDSSLKAIASRYEVLKAKGLIPVDLAARAFPKEDTAQVEPRLAEWISWVDTHVDKSKDPVDSFSFEVARSLYLSGRIHESVARLRKLAEKQPDSKFAIPAASLTLDTYLASSQWEETADLATSFLEIKAWKGGEFAKRLFSVAADCTYKLIERLYEAKDYASTLKRADSFLKNYGSSQRLAEALTLAGNSALSVGEKDRAQGYFSRLIAEAPGSAGVGAAFINRAKLAEERHEFSQAARDYRSFLTLPPTVAKMEEGARDTVRRKVLALAWLSGETAELRTSLDSKPVCSESLAAECDRYEGLLALERLTRHPDEKAAMDAFDRSRKSFQANRSIWAAAALTHSKELAFRDRLLMLKQLASGWEALDALVRFTMVPYISSTIPRAFEQDRVAMKEVAPLKADQKWIAARIDRIKEMEAAATLVMKNIPWSKVRALTLNEVAGLYVDLSHGLSTLSPPKGLPETELASYESTIRQLVIPFEEKAQELRQKAFEIASENAIEDEAFHSVADVYFQDNPSTAAKLKPAALPAQPEPISLALLERFDPNGQWRNAQKDTFKATSEALEVKHRWALAVTHRNWPQVAFLMQEAKEKKLFSDPVQGLVRAVSLASAGAQAEAMAELSDVATDVGLKEQPLAFRYMIERYYSVFVRKKVDSWSKRLKDADPLGSVTFLSSVRWADQPKAPAVANQGDSSKPAVRAPASGKAEKPHS